MCLKNVIARAKITLRAQAIFYSSASLAVHIYLICILLAISNLEVYVLNHSFASRTLKISID